MMQSIPEAVWAALLGSFLTLIGVVLTNRHHRSVQLTQLEHKSREKDRQRKFESRAAVYLDAAAEIAAAQQVLGNLSNWDFSKGNPSDLLAGFVSAANQAVLIARDDTAAKINDFLDAFFASFFYLLPRLSPLHDAKIDRDIENDIYHACQSEVNRILATMTHINETHNRDAVDWDALNRNLEFNQARMEEAAERRGRAWDKVNQLNIEFMDEVVDQSKKISRVMLHALVALRSDLEISTDIDRYQKQLEKRIELMDQVIENFKDSIRQRAS
jgi:hypothetical protein